MSENHLFEMTVIPTPMPVKIVLYDGQEVDISISTSTETDMPSLRSNNPNFVKLMSNKFEGIWKNTVQF